MANKKGMIIGFSGKIGVGKDTCAQFLAECIQSKLGIKYELIAMADALKQFCSKVSGIQLEAFYHRTDKEKEVELLLDKGLFEETLKTEITNIFKKAGYVIPSKEDVDVLIDYVMTEFVRQKDQRTVWERIVQFFRGDVTYRIKTSPRELCQWFGTEFFRDMVSETIWVDIVENQTTANSIITDIRFPQEAEFVSENGLVVYVERPNNPNKQSDKHTSEGFVPVGENVFKFINSYDDLGGLMNGVQKFLMPQVISRMISVQNDE